VLAIAVQRTKSMATCFDDTADTAAVDACHYDDRRRYEPATEKRREIG